MSRRGQNDEDEENEDKVMIQMKNEVHGEIKYQRRFEMKKMQEKTHLPACSVHLLHLRTRCTHTVIECNLFESLRVQKD